MVSEASVHVIMSLGPIVEAQYFMAGVHSGGVLSTHGDLGTKRETGRDWGLNSPSRAHPPNDLTSSLEVPPSSSTTDV
jgi:hypothetical protein